MCSRMVSYYEKRFDGLLFGLTGPSGPMASHVSEDSPEQVRQHLVSYLVSNVNFLFMGLFVAEYY